MSNIVDNDVLFEKFVSYQILLFVNKECTSVSSQLDPVRTSDHTDPLSHPKRIDSN